MKRIFLTAFLLLAAVAAHADAPAGQTPIAAHQVLRGHFTERRQTNDGAPLQSTGHFTLAPAYGLLWGMEKPMLTTTIITPAGVSQDLGGLAIKLPAKNLRHLYDRVGAALTGDWSGLEQEFTATPSGTPAHWQMLLTPRPGVNAKPAFTNITVSGGKFVENIVLANGDGTSDSFAFTGAVLSPLPLMPVETALFAEAGK